MNNVADKRIKIYYTVNIQSAFLQIFLVNYSKIASQLQKKACIRLDDNWCES